MRLMCDVSSLALIRCGCRRLSGPHFPTQAKETIVNKLNAILLALMLGAGVGLAQADDIPTNAAIKSKATRPPVAQPVAQPAVAPVKVSQQDKMRLCSKQATGKKGAERKDFMRTCLSKKA
jgi:hypothetical protein